MEFSNLLLANVQLNKYLMGHIGKNMLLSSIHTEKNNVLDFLIVPGRQCTPTSHWLQILLILL